MGNELIVIILALTMSLIIFAMFDVAEFIFRLKESFSTKLSIFILLLLGAFFYMVTLKLLLGC